MSFYDSMNADPKLAEFLYCLGVHFLDGEMKDEVGIHEVHLLLRYAVRAVEQYRSTGTLPTSDIWKDGGEDV